MKNKHYFSFTASLILAFLILLVGWTVSAEALSAKSDLLNAVAPFVFLITLIINFYLIKFSYKRFLK